MREEYDDAGYCSHCDALTIHRYSSQVMSVMIPTITMSAWSVVGVSVE